MRQLPDHDEIVQAIIGNNHEPDPTDQVDKILRANVGWQAENVLRLIEHRLTNEETTEQAGRALYAWRLKSQPWIDATWEELPEITRHQFREQARVVLAAVLR